MKKLFTLLFITILSLSLMSPAFALETIKNIDIEKFNKLASTVDQQFKELESKHEAKLKENGSLFNRGLETTLPGLSNFHLVGAWVTSAGALFVNALSGRTVIKAICKSDGKRFQTGCSGVRV